MLLPIFGWCYCHFYDRCYCHGLGWCYCLCIVYGRCYCHIVLADVIANCYVEDVKPHIFDFWNKCDGWCYCLVADGMATAGWLCHVADVIAMGHDLILILVLLLSRTSSQISGRWYLPIFLFRDGLLTLIYNASLIALLRSLVLGGISSLGSGALGQLYWIFLLSLPGGP